MGHAFPIVSSPIIFSPYSLNFVKGGYVLLIGGGSSIMSTWCSQCGVVPHIYHKLPHSGYGSRAAIMGNEIFSCGGGNAKV